MTSMPEQPDPRRSLTPLEIVVLTAVAEGATTRRMARDLVLSERTVNRTVAALLGVFGARSRAQLVHLAWQFGILSKEGTS